MENNYTPHDDFEQFIKKNLQNNEPNVDNSDLWAQIEDRQRKPNRWLKTRHYGKFAIPVFVIALVAFFGWGKWQRDNDNTLANKNNTTQPLEVGIGQNQTPTNGTDPNNSTDLNTITESGTAGTTTLPVCKVRPGATKVNKLPKWYKKNDVPIAAVRFEANAGVQYVNPESGNSVSIRPNSLVYANGQPVQGAVDMYFREYRDIPDMLAAGIPMHFGGEENGDAFFFNTGGMFDVRVSQNGEELFIAPGQTYDVAFNATNNLSNASLYYLDEQRDKWGDENGSGRNNSAQGDKWRFVSNRAFNNPGMNRFDARTVANNPEPGAPISTEPTVIQENTGKEPCLPPLPNFQPAKDGVKWVQEAVTLGTRLTTGKYSVPVWFRKNPTGNDDYFTYAFDRSEIKLVFANDEQLRFFPQDQHGTCSEFAAFKDCYFIRMGDSLPAMTSLGVIDRIFNETSTWRSFTVQPDENIASQCLITLGTEKEGFIRIHAQLVRTNSAGSTSAAFDATKVFKKYWELREKRLNGLMGELHALRHFVEASKMFYEPGEEYCMAEKQWLQYFEQNQPLMRRRYAELERKGYSTNTELVQKAIVDWNKTVTDQRMALADRVAGNMSTGQQLGAVLSLMDFGTYNCDQIFQLARTPIFANVLFKGEKGNMIAASQLRMLEKTSKLFLSMNVPEKMAVLPGRNMDLVVTDQKGRLYHVDSDTYNKAITKEQGTYTITAKDVTDAVQSPSQWAALLGI